MGYFRNILNKLFKRPRINLSSTPLVVVVVVILIIVFSFVNYRFSEQIIEQEAKNKLLLFADAKEGEIYAFINQLEQRAKDFSSDYYIRSEMTRLSDKDDPIIRSNLSQYLKQEKLPLDDRFIGLYVINQHGKVVAATDKMEIGHDDSQAQYFKAGLAGSFTEIPNPDESIHFNADLPVVISVPIYEPETRVVVGVLVAVYTTDELSQVLSGTIATEAGALTQSGGKTDTLDVNLINRTGRVVASRGGEVQTLQTIDNNSIPLRECFDHGREFIGEAVDFIGKQDLTATMCFPKFGWTLVVQQDLDSALIAIKYLQHNVFFSSSLFLILVILFLYFYAQTQKKFNEEKDTFLSLASHQLRTPLGAMRWNLESLLAGDAGEILAPRKEILQEIYKSNSRLIDLMNNLLEITRINQGRKRFTFAPQNPNDIIREAVKAITPLAQARDISISMQLANNAPVMLLEEKHFSEVITNFLSNAIKYSQDGGTIYISTSTEGNKLKVAVKDAGIGIPLADQKNIFSKFYRASNAPLKSPTGEGLGLYLVKTFVELWGGRVWFESVESKGSTFYVQLSIKN